MLAALLERLGLGRHDPLGRVLVRHRVITEEQLRAALEAQRATGGQIGRIVVAKGYASEYDVLQAIYLGTVSDVEAMRWIDNLYG